MTARAAEAALATVQVTVAAETTRAYADTCSANAQIAVAERSVEIQNETLRLTETLLNAGAGTGLDVASARAAAELGLGPHTRAVLAPTGRC